MRPVVVVVAGELLVARVDDRHGPDMLDRRHDHRLERDRLYHRGRRDHGLAVPVDVLVLVCDAAGRQKRRYRRGEWK